jgi:thymidylate synthase
MNSSQLTFLGYGLGLGLLAAAWVAFNAWQRRRALEAEVLKLRAHLQVHLEITHEGSQQLKEDLSQLKQENENLRITLKAWQQKPDRRELRALEVYERAVRQLQGTAPGFAVYWESALQEAEHTVQQIDRGVLAFARRLFVSGRTGTPGNS